MKEQQQSTVKDCTKYDLWAYHQTAYHNLKQLMENIHLSSHQSLLNLNEPLSGRCEYQHLSVVALSCPSKYFVNEGDWWINYCLATLIVDHPGNSVVKAICVLYCPRPVSSRQLHIIILKARLSRKKAVTAVWFWEVQIKTTFTFLREKLSSHFYLLF